MKMKMIKVVILLGMLVSLEASELKINQILDDYISAWNEHNTKKIETFYADDVIWYDLSYDYTTKGKSNVSKAITNAFLANVPDMYWARSGDIFISGNTIVYEWVYGGTFSGKWESEIVKNKKFQIKGISTTTIDEKGKIISHKDYYDTYSFLKQLGLSK
jgi:steroid delta-isomerase-like uncharacterized protein